MSSGYFHGVHEKTPTRFWVNNPTPAEARTAIAAGTEYCTTNPTYAAKMAAHPETADAAGLVIREVLESTDDLSEAASEVQSRLVRGLLEIFRPVHDAAGGKRGWVSIQGDPEKEDSARAILSEAERNRSLAPNYIAKVPVTLSGLEAIRELCREGVPVIATEVMSVAQAVEAAESYVAAISGLKNPAPIYITHITGIFDQHLGSWNETAGAGLSEAALRHAGTFVAKKLYGLFKERGYPATILGGGARALHHFTDFVGADMHVTINWKGTADKLLEASPPVTAGFDVSVDPEVLEELLEKSPVFAKAWNEGGLVSGDYSDFPPVELFRSMFLKGWIDLKGRIKGVRDGKQGD